LFDDAFVLYDCLLVWRSGEALIPPSRHDTTRSTCRAPCILRTAWLDTLLSTLRTCHVVSRRDVTSQVEFGLNGVGHINKVKLHRARLVLELVSPKGAT